MSFETLLKEDEKLQLITHVGESFRLNPGEIRLTDEQRAELKRRREAYRQNPDDVLKLETTVEYIHENPRMLPLVEEDIRRALSHGKVHFHVYYNYRL